MKYTDLEEGVTGNHITLFGGKRNVMMIEPAASRWLLPHVVVNSRLRSGESQVDTVGEFELKLHKFRKLSLLPQPKTLEVFRGGHCSSQ